MLTTGGHSRVILLGPDSSHPASAALVRQAVAQEPYLTALRDMHTSSGVSASTPDLIALPSVLTTKRQVQDFVDQEPSPLRVATTSITATKVFMPPTQDAPADDSTGVLVLQKEERQSDLNSRLIHDRSKHSGATKSRPTSCLLVNSKRVPSGGDSPLVKHPMRLVAAKLMASLTAHTMSPNQCDGKPSHTYFQDIFFQVAAQLEQQPSTAGLAQVLRQIWTVHVDPLHNDVERSKRLGLLTFAKEVHDAVVATNNDDTRAFTRPSKRDRHNSQRAPLNRLQRTASSIAKITPRGIKSSVAAPSFTPPDEICPSASVGRTNSSSASLEDSCVRQTRRHSEAVLTFAHIDQVQQVGKILSAKERVKALRLELISMQRLRESIFATVLSADAARQKDIDTRMRLRITAQLEQTLQKRYSVVPESMTLAAIQIQRMARGKLAGKRMRMARIVALMHLSKDLFRRKLQKREWQELDGVPNDVPIDELEEEMKAIVWEVTRLVRDLSLDWWKLSLSEERARLTWELSDAKDDLRHVHQQTSVLMQNISFGMSVATAPMLTKAHEARLGVHQYYSPSPRVADSTKELMDSIASINSKLEDFNFAVAKAKQTRTTASTQTDSTLQKQPTYLQALAKLAKLQDAITTSCPAADEESQADMVSDSPSRSADRMLDAPLPPQSYTVEPSAEVEASARAVADPAVGKFPTTARLDTPAESLPSSKKRPLHRTPKAATAPPPVPGLNDVPSIVAKEFKIVGKTQPHKPKIMCVAQLKLLLHEVYAARAIDELRSPVGEFLYRFFALKYGLRHVAEMYLVNFIASVKKFWKHDPEIRLCARVCHLRHTTPLSLDALDFYAGLLVGLGIHRHEAVIPVWFLPHLVRHAVDLIQKYEPGCMLEIVHHNPDATYKAIEGKLSKLPPAATHHDIGFSMASLTYVDRDDALAICVDAFEAVELAIHNHLVQAFHAADIDKNGVLCFAEFNSLVQKVYSTPHSHVQRMFFDAISLSGHPQHDAILPEVFVSIAKKEGLSRKSYVNERRDAITLPVDISVVQNEDLSSQQPIGQA
ncbi:hypothetical protein H310_05369 [Aphanomyces invadans]|uniref:EF-hand domain-containing protein n=1 Tax=Aphanomyces invadans TaxID=157072 RepID=A0A024U9Q4_9STRA|nr:hypothetical protein H310_05369 [Aphanomyces invadans]ETW02905.1 hypothetical protein H310_05369 [Aphanomyces invadans]|eukprot:XP_008868289.1 hypothetical protein H310_05369 [Aphanomyces invadans]